MQSTWHSVLILSMAVYARLSGWDCRATKPQSCAWACSVDLYLPRGFRGPQRPSSAESLLVSRRELGLDFRMDDDGTDLLYESKVECFEDGPENRYASGAGSAAAHLSLVPTPMQTCRCCDSRPLLNDPGCGCWYCTTTLARVRLHKRHRGCACPCERPILDGDQHRRRLVEVFGDEALTAA